MWESSPVWGDKVQSLQRSREGMRWIGILEIEKRGRRQIKRREARNSTTKGDLEKTKTEERLKQKVLFEARPASSFS